MNKKLTSVKNFIKENPVPIIYAVSVVVCVGTIAYLQKANANNLDMSKTFLNIADSEIERMAETGDLLLFPGKDHDFLLKLTPKS